MTPKEKAKELYLKMLSWQDNSIEYLERNVISTSAKKCALIAVDEILNNDGFTQFDIYLTEYWEEVREEIINF